MSRKVGQSFWVGEDVKVTVVDRENAKVRLKIEAPDRIRIDRTEVREERLAEHRQ